MLGDIVTESPHPSYWWCHNWQTSIIDATSTNDDMQQKKKVENIMKQNNEHAESWDIC